jgi:hypothetical protein
MGVRRHGRDDVQRGPRLPPGVPDAGFWENARTGYHPGVQIDVSCAEQLLIRESAVGREATVFRADSLQGGTGASVYQPSAGA